MCDLTTGKALVIGVVVEGVGIVAVDGALPLENRLCKGRCQICTHHGVDGLPIGFTQLAVTALIQRTQDQKTCGAELDGFLRVSRPDTAVVKRQFVVNP